MDEALWLQKWYLSHCDGSWEHSFGVKIGNLDNPGWRVFIDLTGTEAESRVLTRVVIERSENNWIVLETESGRFIGHGGPLNLVDILVAFRRWWEGAADDELVDRPNVTG